MNQGGRVLLLGTAVVLLIIGVICLKQRLGGVHAPAAFLKAEDSPPKETPVQNQPTILSADPSSAQPLAPTWHDPRVVPLSSPVDSIPTYPVTSESAPFEVTPEAPPLPNAFDEEPLPPLNRSTRVPDSRDLLRDTVVEPLSETPVQPSLSAHLEPPSEIAGSIEPDSSSAPVAALRPEVVVTEKDDSLWSIAEKVYGEGRFFRALFAMNRDRIPRPDRIHEGIEILTPSPDELRQLFPDLCPAYTAPPAAS